MSSYQEYVQYFTEHPFEAHMAPEQPPVIDFDIEVYPQQLKRMVSLINAVAENSPLGRSVLEKAHKAGYKLDFQFMSNAKGAANQNSKTITLNPSFSDAALMSSLVHECRHAGQYAAGYSCDFQNYTVKSALMTSRAMEADAQAVAAGACMEYAAATGNKAPLTAMKMNALQVVSNVSPFLEKGQKNADAAVLRAGFNGWYDNEAMVRSYEIQYLLSPTRSAQWGGKEGTYDKNPTSEQIVSDLCKTADGDGYFKNSPNVLESEKKIAISKDIAETLDDYFKKRKERTGQEPDVSYKNLPQKNAPHQEKKKSTGMTISAGSFFDLKKRQGR